MATMRERSGGKWYVEIRRKDYPPINKTFKTKTAAKMFIYRTEADMDAGTWRDPRLQKDVTVVDALQLYLEEIAEEKNVGRSKLSCIRRMQREPLFQGVLIQELDAGTLNKYAKKRRLKVGPKTLNDDFSFLGAAIDMTTTLMGLGSMVNVAREYKKVLAHKGLVRGSKRRTRRLQEGEEEKLLKATAGHWLHPILKIAIASGLRQEEIHKLEWSDIDFEKNVMLIRDRKDPGRKRGNDQLIPLLPAVREVLVREYSKGDGRKVFPNPALTSSVSDSFAKITKKLEVDELTFHDLRHEAISRLFERGLSIPEVALISGHKNWDTLKRYTHLNPETLASKL